MENEEISEERRALRAMAVQAGLHWRAVDRLLDFVSEKLDAEGAAEASSRLRDLLRSHG